MALIKCEECGNEVSDKAAACPKCGAPVATRRPEPVPEEVDDGPKCPFCKHPLDPSAVTCGFCGAEYGYYNESNGQVTSGPKMKLITMLLVAECVLALILWSIGSSFRFTERQVFFWMSLAAVVVGLGAAFTFIVLLTALRMKSRGKQWWKAR